MRIQRTKIHIPEKVCLKTMDLSNVIELLDKAERLTPSRTNRKIGK